MTADVVLEEKEKERRKLKLIIHNILESNLAEWQERKKEDIDNLNI